MTEASNAPRKPSSREKNKEVSSSSHPDGIATTETLMAYSP